MPAGISTGLCILILLVSRSLFHGPMMLLANFVALPVNVSALSAALSQEPCQSPLVCMAPPPLFRGWQVHAEQEVVMQGRAYRQCGHSMLA